MESAMYDAFSGDYDRFVDWPARLAGELPFIKQLLEDTGAKQVLDAACGTGAHAVALAELGYEVVGADFSPAMIEQARARATDADQQVRLEVAPFGELSAVVGGGFDALLCLGNSLPHVLDRAELKLTLADFAACLRPGGLLLIQNRNFDRVLSRRERWMEPQARREGASEWLFVRFYDFEPDGRLAFHVVTLQREGTRLWRQRVISTRLWPQTRDELVSAVRADAFGQVLLHGNLRRDPFEVKVSPNLVLTARRRE